LKIEVKLLLSANRNSCIPPQLAQQHMTRVTFNGRFRIARYLCGSWASCYL